MRWYNRFLYSLYVGILALIVSLFFWGPRGLVSYNEKVAFRDQLKGQVCQMEEANLTLTRDLTLVREDFSEVYLRARQLGYYQEGEVSIIYEDEANANNLSYVNECLTVPPFDKTFNPLFYFCSLSLAIITFIFLSFFTKRPKYDYSKRRLTEFDAMHSAFDAEPSYRRSL